MNTKPLQFIHLAVCAAVLSFASGCGSSNSDDFSIELANGVRLEMVRIPDSFGKLWFGKTEVTQAQWEAVMGDNPSKFKNPNNPVERVSRNDCREFCGS